MSEHGLTDLQNMIFRPRKEGSNDPQIDSSKRAVGDDGKLYKKIDHKDYGIFNVLNEDELRVEARKAQEMATGILEMGASLDKQTRSTTKSPPKLGMARTSVLIANRQRQKEAAELEAVTPAAEKAGAPLHTTDYEEPIGSAPKGPQGGFGIHQTVAERNAATIGIITSKFTENLNVVEQLYDEKRSLEEHIENLESQLQRTGASKLTKSISGGTFQEQVEAAKEVVSPHRQGRAPNPGRSTSPNTRGQKSKPGIMRTARSASAGTKRSTQPQATRSMGAAAAADLFGGANRQSTRALRQSQFVLQLQADSDRYIQKRKAAEEKERKAKLEADQYEQEKYKRLLKANKAEPFYGMIERAEQAAEVNTERRARKQREREEAERKEAAARRKKRLDHLNKQLPKNEMTWKEMEEQKVAERMERVERRKVELSMTAKAPPGMDKQSKREIRLEVYEKPKVEDPERVTARLASQQRKWDAKLEEIRFKNEQQARLRRAEIDPSVKSMERRLALQEQKKKEKADEKNALKAAQDQKLANKKRRELEILMNQKVPEASRKLTRSSEVRAQLVRKSMDDKILKEKQDAMKNKKREDKMKAMSSVMKNIVLERETYRKNQVQGYVELSGSEDRAAENARKARQEFRENLRNNKAKLKKARDSAPTLMQRMDRENAVKTAENKALNIIKDAIGHAVDENQDETDLFDEYEKMKLGLM